MRVDKQTGQVSESGGATPLLEVDNLSVTLGGNRILADVSFAVRPASIHALIGPNGAGKTTLIRSIMGGMPHRGTIRFNFRGDGRIGYVPQFLDFDRALPMTVGDFLALMLRRRPVFFGSAKKVRRQIAETLALTQTDHLIDRLIGGLSGGELRRVLLAQALTPLPEFLLLDEPASNVDEQGAQMFEDILLRLQRERNLTVLMVGHDIAMILRVADVATGINRAVTFHGNPKILCDPARLGELFGAESLAIDKHAARCD